MKKIIHLSDIHLGHEDCGDKFRAIIDRIIELKKPASDYIVLITGDIVDNANKNELLDEALEVLNKLTINGYRLLLIPGNHDYGTGSLGNKKFVEPFKEKFYGTTKITYPKLDLIDEIAFIGLDSTAEELHWRDRILSEGELGRKQLSRLKKILLQPEVASRKKVVYLHHHPFDFKIGMQLKDRKKLEKIIGNKVDCLLFGHYHRDSEIAGRRSPNTWGIPRCYNAGSSTHKNGDVGVQRVIDLSNPDQFSDDHSEFI